MEGSVLIMFLAASTIAVVFSSPVAPDFSPNYDNVPQCLQPSDSGMCLAYIPSYYYNPSKKTCEQFIYGGCRGNTNRFFNFDECMAKCGGFELKKDETFKLTLESDITDVKEISKENETPETSEVVAAEEDVCLQPSVMGPCRAMMPRFFYNGLECESFIYGGCQGNGNNFRTIEECQQRCPSQTSENSTAASEAGSEESSNEASDESSAETGESSEARPKETPEETSDESPVESKESSEE